MKQCIKVIVIAINNGSGHVFTTPVEVTDDEYRNAEHFRIAVTRATDTGFVTPMLALEADDLVRLLIDISAFIARRNVMHERITRQAGDPLSTSRACRTCLLSPPHGQPDSYRCRTGQHC
ncbi:hypothetical protein B0G76_5840 [Paraburkholderia sp. BL23I1N1]|uniref:hypothetical protein n=1 Tax=Paraburkholderia sp. BL23I1N1 TaxID=1938802 RepID=UPI000E7394C8|nr:hypothetical protein [Paraburkholderia sp. BL23I1N1]RKE39422.1 hypothetical protein B0G76_5840 [Paraburkholderia sp. BL23I1N1]